MSVQSATVVVNSGVVAVSANASVSLASDAETIAGASSGKAVTPASLASTRPYVDVHTYGAVGDGSTDDTSAITAALAAGLALSGFSGGAYPDRRPEVHLRPNKKYDISAITIPQCVVLVGNGSELNATATGTMVTLSKDAGIRDCLLRGLGSGTALTGIHIPSTSVRSRISNVQFDSFAGSAILVEGNAAQIEKCFAQNCVLADTVLASPKGVLHIEGSSANDNTVRDCEFTASNTAMSASGNAYAVVVAGKSNFLDGVIAEISDHGFYLSGNHNMFSNCRADLNRGHGWVCASGTGDLASCTALSNGREATNTYDGFRVTGGSYHFSACSADVLSTLTAVQHRYGFSDASASTLTGSQFDATCYSNQHATAPISVADPSAKVIPTQGPFLNTSGSGTTWNVQTYRWPHSCWNLAASGARNLETLTNAVPGMRVTLRGDGNTTLVHNGSFTADTLRLRGGANLLTAVHTLYEFVYVGGGFWVQVAPGQIPGAYTQTYATADKTHANPTAATLTVTDGAGTNDNTIGAITADASVIAAVQEIADEINKLVADVADVKQLVNSVIDDLQTLGILS